MSGCEISIQLKEDWVGSGDAGEGSAAYEIAGHRLLCDQPVAELDPFRAAAPCVGPSRTPVREPSGPVRRIYHGRGWVGGKHLEVECSDDATGYRLAVEGGGLVWIGRSGQRIVRLPAPPPQDPAIAVQAVLGPALCLALALQEVFCLHASAIANGGAAIALVGPSGVGKSTLAARLVGHPDLDWHRAADDVLPLALEDRQSPVVRPNFPQLKLTAIEQWGRERPAALPLAAAYVLSLGGEGSRFECERLSPRDGAVSLVRHTVAGRLFDPGLRTRHLDFTLSLAARVPVYRMRIPRAPGLEPGLIEQIRLDRS